MKTSRPLRFVGLSVLALALLGGSATVEQNEILVESAPGGQSAVYEVVEPSDAVAGLALEVARLRERLDRSPVAQDVARNPLLLIPKESNSEVPPILRSTDVVPESNQQDVATPAAARTTFSFIGIAVEDGQRTAIFLSDDGQVIITGAGGAVANGYRVITIEETAVSVSDSAGVLRRYELR